MIELMAKVLQMINNMMKLIMINKMMNFLLGLSRLRTELSIVGNSRLATGAGAEPEAGVWHGDWKCYVIPASEEKLPAHLRALQMKFEHEADSPGLRALPDQEHLYSRRQVLSGGDHLNRRVRSVIAAFHDGGIDQNGILPEVNDANALKNEANAFGIFEKIDETLTLIWQRQDQVVTISTWSLWEHDRFAERFDPQTLQLGRPKPHVIMDFYYDELEGMLITSVERRRFGKIEHFSTADEIREFMSDLQPYAFNQVYDVSISVVDARLDFVRQRRQLLSYLLPMYYSATLREGIFVASATGQPYFFLFNDSLLCHYASKWTYAKDEELAFFINELIEAGAPVNAVDPRTGQNAFEIAVDCLREKYLNTHHKMMAHLALMAPFAPSTTLRVLADAGADATGVHPHLLFSPGPEPFMEKYFLMENDLIRRANEHREGSYRWLREWVISKH